MAGVMGSLDLGRITSSLACLSLTLSANGGHKATNVSPMAKTNCFLLIANKHSLMSLHLPGEPHTETTDPLSMAVYKEHFHSQNTFQYRQCAHSFPMGEYGDERHLGGVARA